METLIVVVHVIAAISIVALVLLQQGKGADAGAAFGSGASQTVFGASGSGNFLTKATTVAAVLFFSTSMGLAVYAKQQTTGGMGAEGLPSADGLPQSEQQDSDIPRLEEESSSQSGAGDVPALPGQDDSQ